MELLELARKYREMPNGGAILRALPNGVIHNGIVVVARGRNKKHAGEMLRAAGFENRKGDWKLCRCNRT